MYYQFINFNLNQLKLHEPIIVNGLGQSVKFGDLYDWTTHRFTGQSLFSSEIPEKSIKMLDDVSQYLNKGIQNVNSYQAKFKLFDIDSFDIQLSIVSRLIPLTGSAKFFSHRITNKKTIERFWSFTRLLNYKGITITNLDLIPYIDNSTLLNTDATHVAYRIIYGMSAVLSIQSRDSMMVNQTEYRGQVLDKILGLINQEVEKGLKLNKTDYDEMEKDIKYKYYSDYTDVDEPNNLYEAVQQLRQTYLMKDESKLKAFKGLSIIF